MTQAADLNDTLLPVTPSMERYTVQCSALHRACREYLNKNLVFTHIGEMPADEKMRFDSFVIDFMDNNEYDELGNWADVHEYATQSLRTLR